MILLFDSTEYSGRKCADDVALTYNSMIEAISWDFVTASFDSAYKQVQYYDELYLKMANQHPFFKKVIRDRGLGPISEPLAGMTSQLGMYQRTAGDWHTVSCRCKFR